MVYGSFFCPRLFCWNCCNIFDYFYDINFQELAGSEIIKSNLLSRYLPSIPYWKSPPYLTPACFFPWQKYNIPTKTVVVLQYPKSNVKTQIKMLMSDVNMNAKFVKLKFKNYWNNWFVWNFYLYLMPPFVKRFILGAFILVYSIDKFIHNTVKPVY